MNSPSAEEINTGNGSAIAASCNYCGQENPDRLLTCAGCGTALASGAQLSEAESGPRPKSKALAVILALVFGPLGLIYVRAWGAAIVMLIIGAPLVITHTGGAWVTIGGRILCAAWAYFAAIDSDETPNTRRDSARALDEAARLEKSDRAKAIAKYEEIIRNYPETPASREAVRNIQALSRPLE